MVQQPASPETELAAKVPHPMLICLLLALATLVVFSPVGNYDFINYDDPEYVTSNLHVQQGLTINGVVWAFTTFDAANWHPLTWLSHMLDVSLFGITPAGPHMVNLLFHVVNAVLLFLVLRGLTGAQWRSAFVAALFALHPLHVESVAWISERKDVLSTMFWLLTLWAYGRYVEESKVQGPKSKVWYGWALLFFVLGLMTKPMLVTLPFVLLLLDYWPLGRVPGVRCQVSSGAADAGTSSIGNSQRSTLLGLIWEKIPFFLCSGIFCVVTLFAQSQAIIFLKTFPFGMRIINAFVSYARYLEKIFWPGNLALPYPYPTQWPLLEVVVDVVLLVGVTVATLWFVRKLPFVLTGWLWFLGTLVPVIGLVQVGVQSMADRYSYVPLIGIFIILSWGAEKVVTRWRLPKLAAGTAGVLVLGVCSMLTRHQLGYWQNSETLFRHAIAVTENNIPAYDNIGYYFYRRGLFDEAITNYQQALRLNPDNANTLNNMGSALTRQKKYPEAIRYYEAALRLVPDYTDAHNNLGAVLYTMGRTTEAIRHYDQALHLAPDNAEAHNNLGNALIAQGKVEEAIEHYRQALKLNPNFTEALNNLGWVLAANKRYAEASLYYQQALRLNPDNPETRFILGCILVQTGRREEAVVQLKEALRLKPDYPEAKRELQALGVPVPE